MTSGFHRFLEIALAVVIRFVVFASLLGILVQEKVTGKKKISGLVAF